MKIAFAVLLNRLFPGHGLFLSWITTLAVLIVPINGAIFSRFFKTHMAGGATDRLTFGDIKRFLAVDYFASLLSLAYMGIAPLLVFAYLGSRAAAPFTVAFMIGSALDAVTYSVAASVTVHAARDHRQLGNVVGRALGRFTMLLLPTVVGVVVAAPIILGAFGADYRTHGTATLRLMALATLPHVVIAVALAVARLKGDSGWIFRQQAAICALVLGGSFVLIRVDQDRGFGVAWLVSHVVIGVLAAAFLRRGLGLVRADFGLSRRLDYPVRDQPCGALTTMAQESNGKLGS